MKILREIGDYLKNLVAYPTSRGWWRWCGFSFAPPIFSLFLSPKMQMVITHFYFRKVNHDRCSVIIIVLKKRCNKDRPTTAPSSPPPGGIDLLLALFSSGLIKSFAQKESPFFEWFSWKRAVFNFNFFEKCDGKILINCFLKIHFIFYLLLFMVSFCFNLWSFNAFDIFNGLSLTTQQPCLTRCFVFQLRLKILQNHTKIPQLMTGMAKFAWQSKASDPLLILKVFMNARHCRIRRWRNSVLTRNISEFGSTVIAPKALNSMKLSSDVSRKRSFDANKPPVAPTPPCPVVPLPVKVGCTWISHFKTMSDYYYYYYL